MKVVVPHDGARLGRRYSSGIRNMQNRAPDFYLTAAGEYGPLADVRACSAGDRLQDDYRDDYMKIAIEPPLIGQPFGLGQNDISELLIAARWKGFSLYPVNQWPLSVYVIRIIDPSILQEKYFRKDQVQLIAWAMLYKTRLDAAVASTR